MVYESERILNLLVGSLKAHIDANYDPALRARILYENYSVPFFEIEARQDLTFARIAIAEFNEATSDLVGAKKPAQSDQFYTIDTSVVRSFQNQNSLRGEIQIMRLRDLIIGWAQEVDVSALTNGYIYTLTYLNAQFFERNDRYVSRTLTFSSTRDLLKPQHHGNQNN